MLALGVGALLSSKSVDQLFASTDTLVADLTVSPFNTVAEMGLDQVDRYHILNRNPGSSASRKTSGHRLMNLSPAVKPHHRSQLPS